MTLSATPSACALGGGASAKASGGRAKHTHPSQPQNPFSLVLGTITSIFCSLRPCAPYLCGPFPPLSEGGLASTEHAVSAVGFETLARASLTRSYPCLYWAVPRAPGEATPVSTVKCLSALAASRGSVLAQNFRIASTSPTATLLGASARARHGSSAASQMPIKGIFSPLLMCPLRPAICRLLLLRSTCPRKSSSLQRCCPRIFTPRAASVFLSAAAPHHCAV